MKINCDIRKIILAVISLIVAGPVFFLMSCPIINNVSAKRIATEICGIPLPEMTERLEEVSCAGKLVGNGNGMQFFGAILIESELSMEELEQYYSQYQKNEWSCLVEKQKTRQIRVVEHGTLFFTSDVEDRNCYIVYSWGEGIAPFNLFDLRGN